jgi:hypothetical protein
MATKTTLIEVTACDNELYVIASTAAFSSELLHIKSGYGDPVSYKVKPQSILAAGSYSLIFVGINWGGPSAFKVTLTQSSGAPIVLTAPTNLPVGATWTPPAVATTV